jgi:hypothetical protein
MNGSFAPEAALGGIEIQLPLYPRKLTQRGHRRMSEKCQERDATRIRQLTAALEAWTSILRFGGDLFVK